MGIQKNIVGDIKDNAEVDHGVDQAYVREKQAKDAKYGYLQDDPTDNQTLQDDPTAKELEDHPTTKTEAELELEDQQAYADLDYDKAIAAHQMDGAEKYDGFEFE